MKQVFACSDLHGSLKFFNIIKSKMTYGDVLYVIGDVADRGKNGYAMMKEILSHPETYVYLKGNHEDLFVKAAREINDYAHEEGITKSAAFEILKDDYFSAVGSHFYNGGESTIRAWLADGGFMNIINTLDKLPLWITYKNYDICHSGVIKGQWLEREKVGNQEFIWNRRHFNQAWFEGRWLIHGHTPVEGKPEGFSLKYEMFPTPTRVINPDTRKIDLDMGNFFSGQQVLFNLTLGEAQILDKDGSVDEIQKI